MNRCFIPHIVITFFFSFTATAYTSPIKALEFLEGHAQEVDLALVAVHMEELHGFQFLDIVSDAHKNVQVISKCQFPS
jgi:two-component SAPR family response regulator